mgnify:CR=1 FL=1
MAGKRNTVTIPRTYKSGAHRVRAIYATDQEIGLLGALDGRTENQYGPGGLLVLAPPRGGPHQDDYGIAWDFDDPFDRDPFGASDPPGYGGDIGWGPPAISTAPVGGHHLGEGPAGDEPWDFDASTWDIGDIFIPDVDHDPNGGDDDTTDTGTSDTPDTTDTPDTPDTVTTTDGDTVVVDTRTGTLRRIPFGAARLAQRPAWTHPMSLLDYETPSMQTGGLWEGLGAEYQPGTVEGLGLISQALRTPYQMPAMSDIPPGWMGSDITYIAEPETTTTDNSSQSTAKSDIDPTNPDSVHFSSLPNMYYWNGAMWLRRKT